MKILADQIFATLGLPWDSKLANLTLDEDRMIVETIPEYLLRVDLNSRYLGLSPIILFPPGTYEINDFLAQCKNGPIYWRQYVFDTTIEDIGLVELIITAAQGIQGIAGGEQGPQGVIGSQGGLGETSQGTQGTQGNLGVQGRMGTVGLQGIQGLRGSQGLIGYGVQGAVGDVTEVQGIQGNPGIQGHMGTVGLQGIQGLRGSQGTSIQGTQGLLGIQGFRGLQGIQGAAGEGGATTFLDLTDTPSAYTGQSGKFVAVASGEGGVEFVDAPSGEDNYVDGATFSGTTRDLTLTRTGDLEDITVNIPCCDPTEVIQGAVTNIEYGALYNWYAATDERNIANVGFDIPSYEDGLTLYNYCGGTNDEFFNKLANLGFVTLEGIKQLFIDSGQEVPPDEVILSMIEPINANITNEYNFSFKSSGFRFFGTNLGSTDMGFQSGFWLKEIIQGDFYARHAYFMPPGMGAGSSVGWTGDHRIGMSIRLVRPATEAELLLADGTFCTPYIGNDGKIYQTVKIGTQVWLADNLAETKYRNGDLISNHGETYTDKYTNAEWTALTTEAMCWYDDNLDNGYTDVAVIQHNALGGLQGGSTLERYHHTKAEADTHVYEAPIDGDAYVRKDGAWEIMPESSGGSIIEKISFEYKDIETGVSQTYWLDDIAKYGYTILGAILCSNTTMGAVEIQINGTPVIFGSNSYIDVTTSSADTEATDDNVVVEDDVVTLVTSGTDGGAEYLRGSIYYQRT